MWGWMRRWESGKGIRGLGPGMIGGKEEAIKRRWRREGDEGTGMKVGNEGAGMTGWG